MKFSIPYSMQAEHEALHADLEKAIASGGETGAAAKVVAHVLHAHFESEEKYALPPLGLLPALAEGKISHEMTQVLEMTDTLKAELPRMLEEHKVIVDALQKLIEAASQEQVINIAGIKTSIRNLVNTLAMPLIATWLIGIYSIRRMKIDTPSTKRHCIRVRPLLDDILLP